MKLLQHSQRLEINYFREGKNLIFGASNNDLLLVRFIQKIIIFAEPQNSTVYPFSNNIYAFFEN